MPPASARQSDAVKTQELVRDLRQWASDPSGALVASDLTRARHEPLPLRPCHEDHELECAACAGRLKCARCAATEAVNLGYGGIYCSQCRSVPRQGIDSMSDAQIRSLLRSESQGTFAEFSCSMLIGAFVLFAFPLTIFLGFGFKSADLYFTLVAVVGAILGAARFFGDNARAAAHVDELPSDLLRQRYRDRCPQRADVKCSCGCWVPPSARRCGCCSRVRPVF